MTCAYCHEHAETTCEECGRPMCDQHVTRSAEAGHQCNPAGDLQVHFYRLHGRVPDCGELTTAGATLADK